MRIDFQQGSIPKVFVEEPDLTVLAEGRRLPHVYKQKPTRLCLYLPGACEWEGWMRLDQTIVPWASLWLFYFEEWLGSDDWKGGGVFPSERSTKRRGSAGRTRGRAEAPTTR